MSHDTSHVTFSIVFPIALVAQAIAAGRVHLVDAGGRRVEGDPEDLARSLHDGGRGEAVRP